MNHLFLGSWAEFWVDWRGRFLCITVGLVVGLLIGLFVRFRSLGIFMSILLACVGSYCCDYYFFEKFHISKNEIANEIVACTVGALVLSLSINLIFGSNRGKDRTMWRA